MLRNPLLLGKLNEFWEFFKLFWGNYYFYIWIYRKH